MKRDVFRKIERLTYYLLCLSLIVFVSCEEEGAEFIDDLDVVITRFDNNFDFSSSKTYVMPDTIVHIPEWTNYTKSDSAFDQAVLNRVKENMASLGYVRLIENGEETDTPDLVLTLTLINREFHGTYGWGHDPWFSYWSWYNWGYWGYYWIGPGWYPFYPGYWRVYLYTTGTLVLDMMHPQEGSSTEEIPVVWNGIFDGIHSLGLSSRMLNGIDQMFAQSPYLK